MINNFDLKNLISLYISSNKKRLYYCCFAGHPILNDQLYNHPVFGPLKGRGGNLGKSGRSHTAGTAHTILKK